MTDLAPKIQRMFDDVVNRGEIALVDELFAPEFISHTAMGDLDREGFKGFVTGWRTGFPDVRCEVSQFLQQGDKCSWTIRATGTHQGEFNGIPATGKSIDFLSMNHAEFRDGLGREHWVVFDMVTMLTQLGVMPSPGA